MLSMAESVFQGGLSGAHQSRPRPTVQDAWGVSRPPACIREKRDLETRATHTGPDAGSLHSADSQPQSSLVLPSCPPHGPCSAVYRVLRGSLSGPLSL